MRRLMLCVVSTLLACAMAQAVAWPSFFLSWPIQEVERRQNMYTAGFPAVVFTTRTPSGQPDAGREVVGVATDPNGLLRADFDTDVEIHLNYALGAGSVEDCYAVVGGAKAEPNSRPLPEPDKANRFGSFDKASQVLRISFADKVNAQRKYQVSNPGAFREDLPVQIVCVDPQGERKEKTFLFFFRTVSRRATYMSQTLVFHWENQGNWQLDDGDSRRPTSARELRERVAALRLWQRSSVDVSGDSFAARLFTAVEPQMQVWVSSPQVVVEYENVSGALTAGPRLTGLILFFKKGATVSKPWLPGQPVKWLRLNRGNIKFPSYVEAILRGRQDVEPVLLLWTGDRSHAHFLIHQATFNALPEGLQVAFLAVSRQDGDSTWDWADGGADGAVVPLAPGAMERRLVRQLPAGVEPDSWEFDLSDLLVGLRPEPARAEPTPAPADPPAETVVPVPVR